MKNRLRDLRNDKDVYLEDVERATGISLSKLSRMETDKQPVIDEDLIRLSKYYGVPIDYILYNDEKIKTDKVILEKPPTYMNILQGLDDCTDEQLGRIANIITEYLPPRRAKAKTEAPKAGTGTKTTTIQKEGSAKGDS